MPKKLSIKIGSRKISIVEGVKNKNSLSILKHVIIDTPVNSVEDGKIINLDLVAAAISDALKTNKIRTKNVNYIINTSSVITRVVKLPFVQNTKDAISMIRYELEQSMPIDLNKYYFIYKIVDVYMEENIKKADYSIYGIENEMYEDYLELSNKLKVIPAFMDLAFNSLSYLYKNNLYINEKSIIDSAIIGFIDFGYKYTTFSVLHNGVNDFSRVIQGGFKNIEDNLIENYSMSKDDIIDFVKNTSLSNNGDSNYNARIDSIRTIIQSYLEELNRYIKYYNTKSKDTQIEKIYVYGIYSYIRDLEEYFSRALGIDIIVVDNISNVKLIDKTRDSFNTKDYLDNLLSLYDTKDETHFFSEKNAKHKLNFNKFFAGVTVSSIIFVVVLYFCFVYFNNIRIMREEINSMNVFLHTDVNNELIKEYYETNNKIVLIEDCITKLEQINNNVNSLDVVKTDMIIAIAKNTPDDTTIKSMSIDKGSIQFQCNSSSRNSAAQFINNLKAIDFIHDAYIPSIAQSEINDTLEYSYVIICRIGDEENNEAE